MSKLTKEEIEQGLTHLEHQFMTPRIWSEQVAELLEPCGLCEKTQDNCSMLPASDMKSITDCGCKWAIRSAKWWCQLSASGYMDQTDTDGPFGSLEEAEIALVEAYADDIDDCPDCEVN